jgi:hypothetical protein
MSRAGIPAVLWIFTAFGATNAWAQRLPEAQALDYLAPIHGVRQYPIELRLRVAQDTHMMQLFADILERRRSLDQPWSRSVAI